MTDVEYFDNNSVLTKHVHYVYDVFNHLLATEADTTGSGSYNEVEHYVLDVSPQAPKAGVPGTLPAGPVLKFDVNGNLTDRVFEALGRIFAEGAVSALAQADTPSWMLANNEGSVCYVLNNASSVIDKIVYGSFGNVAYESNAAIEHFAGYAGGHVDPFTGLTNDYERWYDPIDAKWLSDDPLGFTAGDSDLSRYVRNSAANAVDLAGLEGDPLNLDPEMSYYNITTSQVTNPNASMSLWFFSMYQTVLSANQVQAGGGLGCFGLMYAYLGIIPANAPTGKNPPYPPNPMLIPGMTMFGSYGGAQSYCALNPGSQMIAYQFQFGPPTSKVPWKAPSPGSIAPSVVPKPIGGTYVNGNWATALYSSMYKKWYWQYMNHGSTTAATTGQGQKVYNTPIDPDVNVYGAGLPTGPGYNSVIYGVYVPPAVPAVVPAPE